jgi:hypothetical protein
MPEMRLGLYAQTGTLPEWYEACAANARNSEPHAGIGLEI